MTLREPVIDGTRLRLNSLTGAYSAGNAITAFRGEGKFEYIFGAPGEDEVVKEVGAAIRAAKVKYDLRRLKMISIGHTPQGFGFGRALDAEMMSTFGTTLDSIEPVSSSTRPRVTPRRSLPTSWLRPARPLSPGGHPGKQRGQLCPPL